MTNPQAATYRQTEDAEFNVGAEYRPNHIPARDRLKSLLFALALFAYGGFGVWVDDLYVPARRGSVHFHGVSAWILYGAMICAALVMISVVVDHYDWRNNEINYKKFCRFFKFLGGVLLAMAFSASMVDLDGSIRQWMVLVLVFMVFATLLFGAVHLMEKREREEQANIGEWRAKEAKAVGDLPARKEPPYIGDDGQTVQRKEYEYRTDSGLYAFQVKRVLRNADGDYFYWVWNSDGQNLLKRMTQVNAKIVLKDQYIEP